MLWYDVGTTNGVENKENGIPLLLSAKKMIKGYWITKRYSECVIM